MHLTVFCGSRIHATEPTLPTGECMSIVRNGFLSLAALAAILSGVPREAHAQGGRIRGVVRDAQGTALSGPVVRAANQNTNSSGRATTTADGGYSFSNLLPGPYSVSASLPGLRTVSQKDVQVGPGAEVTVDIVMQAVELEAVTVTAMLREQELFNVALSIAAPTAPGLRPPGAGHIAAIA